MADLLEFSSRVIDTGVVDAPLNRVTQELSELADGIVVVESFSHVIALRTEAGLVACDTSSAPMGGRVVESLRKWSEDPFHTLLYTHGHVDHVGGSGAFVADSAARGHQTPRVIGHENVPARFARYRKTDGYNRTINARQFGGVRGLDAGGAQSIGGTYSFLPEDAASPDVTFRDRMRIEIGGVEFELRHSLGETDDHLWAWIPSRRAILAGDFFIWNFPNAGNPQKVQRFPLEWAQALREMAGCGAELFMPAHGLPIAGAERIKTVLDDVAGVLEKLVGQTLEMMNAGERLDAIVHGVSVPREVLERPYLRPLYDEPEFVVRNVWRLYGGWYDGNPAHLKPAPDAVFAREVVGLAGGANALVSRARACAEALELRIACQLIELAVQAEPDSREAHAARAEIYEQRRKREGSLMSKGIYGFAARESRARAEGEG
jgi:alkyl sulfatase BDS1-like metallo-beta-lactamase superfamily hydrolase